MIGDDFGVVLVDRAFMRDLLREEGVELADTTRAVAAGYVLLVDSPEDVDAVADRAVAAGAVQTRAEDIGYEKERVFSDPDGHRWNISWVDPLVRTAVLTGDWGGAKAKYPQAGFPG